MMLRRLNLDYLAAPRRTRWIGYALLAVSLAVAAHLLLRYRDARIGLDRTDVAKGLLSTDRRTPKRVALGDNPDEQRKSARAVLGQLALPWLALIGTLEESGTADVGILRLQPDAQQRVLRITAEARHKEAMLEYLHKLVDTKGFTGVHLVSHQVQLDDPQRPVQFSVQASFGAEP